MAGNVQVWEAQRAWLGHRRLGVAQLGAAASLLAFLLAASCNHEGETHATGPTTGVGGGSGGNSNDSGGSGGNSSDGGAAGAQLGSGGSAGAPQSTGGNSGTTGTAGSAGSEEPGTPVCEPSAEAPADTCEYPESLGGGADPTRCGVTPGAWYPLGDSEMTTWPAPWNEPAFETRAHMHTTAVFDLQNQPIVGWVFDGLELRRWNGDVWETLSLGELARTDTADLDLQLDSSGNLVVLEQFEASMRVLRSGDEGWTSLGEWPAAYGPASLAVDAKDRPVVVYGIDGRLHAKRWNGTSFKDLPGNEADGSLSEDAADADPRVAVRQNGDIVVAWAGTLDSAGRIIHIQRFHGGEWGSLSDSTGFPEFRLSSYYYAEPTFAVAVDSNDQVLLAWSEYDSGSVQVWDGTAWQPPEPGLWQPDLLQSLDGTVYLHGNEYSQEAEVWEWQAGDWIESPDLGGAVSGQLKAGRDGTFALASDGYQVAAWEGDYQAGYSRVSVELYADERWRTLDSPTDHGVGVHSGLTQELVASDAGWFLHDSSCGVARWDGGAWRNFDLSEWRTLPSCGGSTLTESPTGQLVLTMWVAQWQYPARDIDGRYPGYDFTVHVLGWNGEAWEPLTDRYDSYGLFEALSTAFDSKGSVFVAWSTLNDANYNTYRSGILAWDGAVWRELPDPRDWNPNNIQLTSLSDDRLLAVWYDEDGEAGWDEGYHAAIYEAGQWHDLPDPPASSAALSATQDKDGTPFLVVTSTTDADLVLYELAASGWRAVAPDEARLSTLPESVRTQVFREAGEVYLRRFEDCSWHGLSASDRGGGISNSAERSLTPSFATHAGTTCVTWTERFEKGSAQFLRCHD